MRCAIDEIVDCLPVVRQTFYADRFDLPLIYLDAVEKMRFRTEEEHSYQFFLDEVLKEYSVLKFPWQPSVRRLLDPAARSKYLDLLTERAHDPAKCLSLDPNFDLFVSLESNRRTQLLDNFRHQKLIETRAHLAEICPPAIDGAGSIMRRILLIAERFGYLPVPPGSTSKDALELRGSRADSLASSLRIVDLAALKKQGGVVVQYFFDEIPGKPFGLDMFVPGGHLYMHGNKGEEEVLFAFYAQCRFLAELCSQAAYQSHRAP